MSAVRLDDVQADARRLLALWHNGGEAGLHPALTEMWEQLGTPLYRPAPGTMVTGLPNYHVPDSVLLAIFQVWNRELQDTARRLAFAESLTRHPALESQRLAVRLLATTDLPPETALERFWLTLRQTPAPALREDMVREWATRLVQAVPQAYLRTWQAAWNQATLQERPTLLLALVPLLEQPGLDLFPQLRDLLEPHLTPPSPDLLPEWQRVLLALLRRRPGEVVPWLRRVVARRPDPIWARLLRRLFPALDEPWRTRLRNLAETLEPK